MPRVLLPAVVSLSLLLPAAPASAAQRPSPEALSAAGVALAVTEVSDTAVDAARGLVVLSSSREDRVVAVGADGSVRSELRVAGPAGLAVDAARGLVHVARPAAGEVLTLTLPDLLVRNRTVTGDASCPTALALSSGRLWVGSGCPGSSSARVSVLDPDQGVQELTGPVEWFEPPRLQGGGDLLVADGPRRDGQPGGRLYDTAGGQLALLRQVGTDARLSADGRRLLESGGRAPVDDATVERESQDHLVARDARTGEPEQSWPGVQLLEQGQVWSPDARRALTRNPDRDLVSVVLADRHPVGLRRLSGRPETLAAEWVAPDRAVLLVRRSFGEPLHALPALDLATDRLRLRLETAQDEVLPGAAVTVRGRLTSTDGTAVADQPLTVTRSGPHGTVDLAGARTDLFGAFAVDDTPGTSGGHTYRVRWAGDARHDPVLAMLPVTVTGPAPAPASVARAGDRRVRVELREPVHALVDERHGRVLVSGDDSVVVHDLAGRPLARLGGLPGASGLALSPDSTTVYITLARDDAVAVVDAARLVEVGRLPVGVLARAPHSAAQRGPHLLVGQGGHAVRLDVRDPGATTGLATVHDLDVAAERRGPAAGELITVTGGRVAPGRVAVRDVAPDGTVRRTSTTLASPGEEAYSTVAADVSVDPLGERVLVAGRLDGKAYELERQSLATGSEVRGRSYLTGSGLADAVDHSQDGSTLAIAVTGGGTRPQVQLFRSGVEAAYRGEDVGAGSEQGRVLAGTLKHTADRLLWVTAEGAASFGGSEPDTRHAVLHVLEDPQQPAPCVAVAEPAPVRVGERLTLTAQVRSADGSPQAGRRVTAADGGHTAEAPTGPDGFATLSLATSSAGTRTVRVHAEGCPAPAERTVHVTASAPPTVTVSPIVISAGQRITATYRGQPGETLTVLSRTQPATTFSRIATVTLDGNGFGTTTHAPQRNTRLAARRADGTSSMQQPLVQVRSVLSMNSTRIGVRTYRFTGRVYPARDQRVVSLYRNGRLIAQGRARADGRYSITKTLPAGRSSYQTRTGNDTYNLGATSRTIGLSPT